MRRPTRRELKKAYSTVEREGGMAIRRLHPSVRRHRGVVHRAVAECPSVLFHLPLALRDEVDIVHTAVSRDPFILEAASPRLRNDPSTVLAALESGAAVLGIASEGVRADPYVVHHAVKKNPENLLYAAPCFWREAELIERAAFSHPWVVGFTLGRSGHVPRSLLKGLVEANDEVIMELPEQWFDEELLEIGVASRARRAARGSCKDGLRKIYASAFERGYVTHAVIMEHLAAYVLSRFELRYICDLLEGDVDIFPEEPSKADVAAAPIHSAFGDVMRQLELPAHRWTEEEIAQADAAEDEWITVEREKEARRLEKLLARQQRRTLKRLPPNRRCPDRS